ncbi:hypothetical protein [Candidatus Harpocratesius sp.]
MVKIPIGEKVEINLWNHQNRHGMVIYYHGTMDICRAESEFELKKGDTAYVVESYDSFVVVVPEDEYTEIIDNFTSSKINYEKLAHKIWEILKEREVDTGGILTIDELYSIFHRTSIQSLISKKLLKKMLKIANAPYDHLKFEKKMYFALKAHEVVQDKAQLISLAQKYPFLTLDMIQSATGWSDVRINRMLNHLVRQNRVRKDETYRTGTRYYFVSTMLQ